jgi:hypothetical protein
VQTQERRDLRRHRKVFTEIFTNTYIAEGDASCRRSHQQEEQQPVSAKATNTESNGDKRVGRPKTQQKTEFPGCREEPAKTRTADTKSSGKQTRETERRGYSAESTNDCQEEPGRVADLENHRDNSTSETVGRRSREGNSQLHRPRAEGNIVTRMSS